MGDTLDELLSPLEPTRVDNLPPPTVEENETLDEALADVCAPASESVSPAPAADPPATKGPPRVLKADLICKIQALEQSLGLQYRYSPGRIGRVKNSDLSVYLKELEGKVQGFARAQMGGMPAGCPCPKGNEGKEGKEGNQSGQAKRQYTLPDGSKVDITPQMLDMMRTDMGMYALMNMTQLAGEVVGGLSQTGVVQAPLSRTKFKGVHIGDMSQQIARDEARYRLIYKNMFELEPERMAFLTHPLIGLGTQFSLNAMQSLKNEDGSPLRERLYRTRRGLVYSPSGDPSDQPAEPSTTAPAL